MQAARRPRPAIEIANERAQAAVDALTIPGEPPDASENIKGIAELASESEARAGADARRITTPQRTLDAIRNATAYHATASRHGAVTTERLLPALPAAGSRDEKVARFDGNTLGWEEMDMQLDIADMLLVRSDQTALTQSLTDLRTKVPALTFEQGVRALRAGGYSGADILAALVAVYTSATATQRATVLETAGYDVEYVVTALKTAFSNIIASRPPPS